MLDRRLRDRYSRQTIFPGIGEGGQAKLVKSTAVLVGCGALGCNIAGLLVRAGVNLRIVDRDFPELHNLQRQVLFDEADVRDRVPKAIAAQRRLTQVNSTVKIEAIVADVNFSNVERLCQGADVILDGLDNFETRLLVNDVALKHGISFIYGSAIGSTGMMMTVLPGKTACYRCIRPVLPDPTRVPTCETAGVVGTVPAIVGALQATEAIKLLVGAETSRGILMLDVWQGTFERVAVNPRTDCPACHRRYEYLEKRFVVKATSLCGQSRSVQVVDTRVGGVALDKLAAALKGRNFHREDHLVSYNVGEHEITVFTDGRAIIRGSQDEATALEFYEKQVAPLLKRQG